MLCCTNWAMACIFANCVSFPEVIAATCCLISGDASKRPARSPEYHRPISLQAANPVEVRPPEGNNVTTICPVTPRMGGMAGSVRIGPTSEIVHCHRLLADSLGFTSAWLSHEALNSHPGGNCRE